MSTYQQHIIEHQRRAILDQLEAENDYTSNTALLRQILKQLGHTLGSDKMQTEAKWLEEQGLVELNAFGGITVLKLTQRGLDVAEGASSIPGIARKGL